jgi:DNA-binding NarL/FixJ family response regulator
VAAGVTAIRVVLADDHTLVRQGIRGLLDLTDDIRVIAEAADGEEALRTLCTVEADVALLDVRMPHQTGVDVIVELSRVKRLIPTLLLTTFDDDEVLLAAMRAGARGYLLKDVSLEQLASAIRTVAGGGSVMQPALTARAQRELSHAPREFPSAAPAERLTRKETEVLRLVAGGWSNREIAQALGGAEGTIKNHISSILSKLGVRDRTRAVLKAIELGYL